MENANVVLFIDIIRIILTYVSFHSSEHHSNRHIVKWTPPQDRCVKLNIDRSCGTFSDIGYDGLLRNKGDWITYFSYNEGQGDALFVEFFWGL